MEQDGDSMTLSSGRSEQFSRTFGGGNNYATNLEEVATTIATGFFSTPCSDALLESNAISKWLVHIF